MISEQKLAKVFHALKDANIDALVMGGHAVRYYGVDRNTNDFDLVISLATADELRGRLAAIKSLGQVRPEPVWRRNDFARFEIGRLADGREEWLEFWLRNHLLDDFQQLQARAESGVYGGELLSFLSLMDLMKSKETERESDWQDIALLEEIQDARNGAQLSDDPSSIIQFLSSLRSRRGMDQAIERKLVKDHSVIFLSLGAARHPVTYAFLAPLLPPTDRPIPAQALDEVSLRLLDAVEFGSTKHFGVVEVVRRTYKRRAMDTDRVDKQLQLKSQQPQ